MSITVTAAQIEAAAKNPGVKSIEKNARGKLGRYATPPKPSSQSTLPAHVLKMKAKRGVEFSTQQDAATELVEVSQPR